jgi:hypothetical protein
MRAFPVNLPSGQRYWTVLDDDLQVVGVADGYLRHQRFGRDGAVGPGGEPKWFNTFQTTKRGFCDKCGSTVAAIDDGGPMMGVTMMALDDHSVLVPIKQSFASNAVPWLAALR